MSRRDKWQRRLDDILGRIERIEKALVNKTYEDLAGDEILTAAIERHIAVIGEAANFLPDAVKNEFSGISWRDICGMRNILVHGYDTIESSILWDTVQKDMAELKLAIIAIKDKHDI